MRTTKNGNGKFFRAIEVKTERRRGDNKNTKTFEIETSHSRWTIVGALAISAIDQREIIFFRILDFPNYTFTIEGEKISGRKVEVKRDSDSGVLSHNENRFNVINKNGERKTIRLGSMVEILPMIFNGVLQNG